LVERYTHGPGIDEPLVGQRQPKIFYYEADGLGSITSLTDPTGAVAATYTYDSFGFMTASTGSATNWFRYTARQFDSSTALYYYRARYYDPTTGRFLSEDRIGFSGGVDFYVYAENSPLNLKDPSGEIIRVTGDFMSYSVARVYLSTSSAAEAIIRDLEAAPEIYWVNVSDTYPRDEQDGYQVFWNPHKGLCVKHGPQSPAIQLLHELIHLWQDRHNRRANLEEEATKMTNPATMQLGEPKRVNYPDARGNPTTLLPIPSGSNQEACECKGSNK
jgi:RHS repeat-associated protein